VGWADTCCIDKRSSAELQEAINSMFLWYRNASLCIVYLGKTTSRRALEDDWFQRGWTLQELLAPKCLRFYMQDWSVLVPSQDKDANDKENNELMTLVSRKTGISNAELRNFYPGLLDLKGQAVEGRIKERMSWAARRETQRLEDIAYSLLGIFGINMPVIYGRRRGLSSAFRKKLSRLLTIGVFLIGLGMLQSSAAC